MFLFNYRLKGKALLEHAKDVNIEALLYGDGKGRHALAIGLEFRNVKLDKIINDLYAEEKVTQAWMKFSSVGKFVFVSYNFLLRASHRIEKRRPLVWKL